jgi:micrococcal nuclease
MRRATAAIVCLLFLSGGAHAYPAIVASVHDGDTLTVIANGQYEKMRLAGIDAPELQVHGKWPDQPFGWEAHTILANLILGQTVDVEPTGETSYGRVVATVAYQDTDIGMILVERGAAWVDTCYDRDPSILEMEHRVQAAKLGLWTKPAIAPWRWRSGFEHRLDNRTCH